MDRNADVDGALRLLGGILDRERARGKETVGISPGSLEALRNLPQQKAARNRSHPVKTAVPPSPSRPEKAPEPPLRMREPTPQEQERERGNEPAQTGAREPASEKTAAAKPAAESAAPKADPANPYGDLAVRTEKRGRVEIIFPAGENVRDRLNNLFRIARQDATARELGTLREQMVFATGNPEAEIMFVGDAPGAEEEEQRQPFVGPAGQKLNQILQAMGLTREKVYISNIVKWRPKIGDGRFQGTKNRTPFPEEIALSVKYVRSEIEIIRPKIIVALGKTASEGLLEKSESAGSLRGRFHELDGIPVVVTYHPSHLIRFDTEPDQERARVEKRKVWEDILLVMEKVGMAISEKQRGFFN